MKTANGRHQQVKAGLCSCGWDSKDYAPRRQRGMWVAHRLLMEKRHEEIGRSHLTADGQPLDTKGGLLFQDR